MRPSLKLTCIAPAELRGRHADYAQVGTPFGPAIAAVSEGALTFFYYPQDADGTDALRRYWRGGTLRENATVVQPVADRAFAAPGTLDLLLVGTPFQHLVWQALAEVPAGQTLSYGALAARIGRPGSARAVGGAVGANPVILMVPCHRVLSGADRLHGFGCGLDLKARLLEAEGISVTA